MYIRSAPTGRGAEIGETLDEDDPYAAPLCSLAFTQYCDSKYSKVYGIQKEGRGRGSPWAVVVQYYCNRSGITGGWDNQMMIGL